jgi:hypothetical protein
MEIYQNGIQRDIMGRLNLSGSGACEHTNKPSRFHRKQEIS